jgi:LmbE family N-acetylglucosaminyl deacetylase
VGVDTIEFLGMPDGIVEYGLPLRRAIAEAIRKHRPDIVITNNFRESWGGTFPNQSDHMAVGRAAIDAVRDAGNRWVFPEQLAGGLEPWGDVRQVWAAGSPDAAHGVDTTDTFDRGVESLKAHQAYIDGLGGAWANFDPVEFLEGVSRPAGTRLGVTFGAAFEVFSMSYGE